MSCRHLVLNTLIILSVLLVVLHVSLVWMADGNTDDVYRHILMFLLIFVGLHTRRKSFHNSCVYVCITTFDNLMDSQSVRRRWSSLYCGQRDATAAAGSAANSSSDCWWPSVHCCRSGLQLMCTADCDYAICTVQIDIYVVIEQTTDWQMGCVGGLYSAVDGRWRYQQGKSTFQPHLHRGCSDRHPSTTPHADIRRRLPSSQWWPAVGQVQWQSRIHCGGTCPRWHTDIWNVRRQQISVDLYCICGDLVIF